MIAGKADGLKIGLLAVIALNILIWGSVRDARTGWPGVPPPPGISTAGALALGDSQLAYRIIGLMLQNLGETGGRSERLAAYDYDSLAEWFYLADRLDPRSSFIPFLAAYYFGAVEDPALLRPLLAYLYDIGRRPGGQRWRWLAHGAYIARYQMDDLDEALKFARALAAVQDPDLPTWARQMPAFILAARGDREEALAVMVEMLRSGAETLHPNEVLFMRDYICTELLEDAAAAGHSLCAD